MCHCPLCDGCAGGERLAHPHPPPTMIDALVIVRQVLERGGMEADNLWSVLTALRGPDELGNSVKYATTAVIRQRAVGWLACQEVGAAWRNDDDTLVHRRRDLHESSHFTNHVWRAFEALGLKWDEANVAPRDPSADTAHTPTIKKE